MATRPVNNGPPPLYVVLIELARLAERRFQTQVSESDVTASQVIALTWIARRPGISRADLARSLQVSPQAVGQLVTQLLEKGLVYRTKTTPGKPVEHSLTDSGYDVVVATTPALLAASEDLLRFFQPNFAEAFDGGMRHVLKRLSCSP